MARTIQTLSVMNLHKMYREVLVAIERHQTDFLTKAHWEAYKTIALVGEDAS